MSEGSTSPKRPRLDYDESSKDDIHDKFGKSRDQDDQGSYSTLRKRRTDIGDDDDDMKDCDDIKSKSLGGDAGRREHTLVMRLTNKEQELQECMNQIQEMKQQQTQNTTQLRSMLLDPAINLVFQRMSKEMEEHKEKLKQKHNELNAWKFTADSQTGMRLMGKCRMLLQENEELGKMIASGRTARLEGEIALHKALVAEMKKNQKELDEFVGELEEDVEGMQGMIFMLQQQLKESREQISRLQQENEQLRTLQLPSEPETGSVFKNGIGADDDDSSKTGSLPSSSYQHINSTTTAHSTKSTDQAQSSSLRVPNNLISFPYSGDSALTCGSTTDEFSPGSFSLKVTPDSGIQTQEDDDPTDSISVDECIKSDSTNECHNPLVDLEPKSAANVSNDISVKNEICSDTLEESNNLDEDSLNLKTSPRAAGEDCSGQSINHSIQKSVIHERTCPTSALLPSLNGDIQVTANVDEGGEESRLSNGVRTPSGEREDENHSKDRTEEDVDIKIDCKLTTNSNDKIEDLSECLGLKQECPTVNSLLG